METSTNLNLWSLMFFNAVFWVRYIFYTTDMWNDLENKFILYEDDITLFAEVASPSFHINVANPSNKDLVKIQPKCFNVGNET